MLLKQCVDVSYEACRHVVSTRGSLDIRVKVCGVPSDGDAAVVAYLWSEGAAPTVLPQQHADIVHTELQNHGVPNDVT